MANPFFPELARLAMMLTARQPNRDFMQAIADSGGDGRSANPAWDAMSNAEKAAYYSDNPTMAAVTQLGQKAIGFAPIPGIGLALRAQQAMFPQYVADQQSVARGIDPGTGLQVGGYGSQPGTSGITPTGLYGDQYASMPAPKSNNFFESLFSSILPSSAVQLNPAPVETREATPVGFSSPTANFGKESSIPTEGIVSPGMDSSVSSGNDFGSFSSSFDGGSYGGYGGEGNDGGYYNQGGMVDAEDLKGQAPGPDDGYGALQGGEYVIKKAAVDKYGQELLDAINNGTFQFKQGLANFMATK